MTYCCDKTAYHRPDVFRSDVTNSSVGGISAIHVMCCMCVPLSVIWPMCCRSAMTEVLASINRTHIRRVSSTGVQSGQIADRDSCLIFLYALHTTELRVKVLVYLTQRPVNVSTRKFIGIYYVHIETHMAFRAHIV